MKSKKETFGDLLQSFTHRYDLRPVFDDFLTLALCAVSHNPSTGKSHYEDLYMETIAPYAKDELRHIFPKMLAMLILEMEERVDSGSGNDVLGETYEQNFCRKNSGQFFTPWHVCEMMSAITVGNADTEADRPLHIIDPTCGSGRMLMAGAKRLGWRHEYYGIDIDHTCVKMTVLNLFLNGIFHAEVMCADALRPDDFRISYVTSFLPFGIFRIEDKEKSKLWHMHRNSFERKTDGPKREISLPSEDGPGTGNGSQLKLF